MSEQEPMSMQKPCQCEDQQREDDAKWLALLLRQGLKIVVVGIERKYGLRETTQAEEKARKAA